ncbi:MAG: MFS transporter, partial [Firmicutes bacterium]|nr:MFS transporter [Bacillota bacterium]
QAVLVEEVPAERLAGVYNLVMAVFGLGLVAGPALGTYLAARWGDRPVFLLAGGLYAAATTVLGGLRPHPPRPGRRRRSWTPRGRPRLFQWTLFAAGLAVVQGLAFPFVVPYLKQVGRLPTEALGILGSAGVLAGTLAAPVWGRVGQRRGLPATLGRGMLLVTAGWILFLWHPDRLDVVLAATLLRGVGEAARGLAGVAVGRTVRAEEAGTAFGLFNFATELAGAFAPLLGGLLYDRWPVLPFALAALATGMLGWWLVEGLPGRPWRPPGLEV